MQIRNSFLRDTRILALGAVLLATGGALLTAVPSFAAPAASSKPDVKAELKAFKVVGDKLEAADTADPGDIIEYQASYTNTGSSPAQRFSPQLPVPDALVYAGNTAAPAGYLATTDGKNFAPAPLMRSVRNPDGTTKMVAVPLREYRALRWQLGTLAPGATVTIKARARVKSFADGK
ncbi:hypothetical protein IAD21_02881 [Abditibacteriota bacterium]|nr:hypothetical protein IAD21_02881 [Abditibacteriota bacterium]